jgi:predicted PurR-regulated permease PerM
MEKPEDDRTGGPPPSRWSRATIVDPLWFVVIVAATALFLAWTLAGALLLLFAGLLFGVFLDACCRGLERVLPISRGWTLTIVVIVFTVLVSVALALGGYTLVTQVDRFVEMLNQQLSAWSEELELLGLEPEGEEGERPLARLIPTPADLFAQARATLTAVTGTIGDMFLILFVGLFAAAQPALYVRGVQKLVRRRVAGRVGEVLGEAGATLRWWLLGQLAAMVLIGVTTWAAMALLGLPSSALLGLQAGLLSFIPYLGPLLGAIAIGLVAASQGMPVLLWALGLYIVIQSIEGYLITPLIQRQAVHLPPLLTLAALILFGAAFGIMGVILATPLAAVLRVFILRFYVEDVLHRSA